MQDILYINNTEADLSPGTVIAVTRQVHDLSNLDSREGGASNTFKLPLTAKNKKALGYPEDVNSGSTIPYTRIEAMYIGGGQQLKGFLEVDTVENDFANCVFYNGNTDLFGALGDLKLNDIDFSAYDVWWSLDSGKIPNVFTSKSNLSGSLFPIIENGESDDFNVLPIDTRKVNPKGLRPALYTHTIISEIINTLGFELQGDFLADERYLNEVVPITKAKPLHSDFWNNENTFEAVSLTDQTFNNEVTVIIFPVEISDIGNNYDTSTNNYICPSDGYYTFSITYQLTVAGAYTIEPASVIIGSNYDGVFTKLAAKLCPTTTGVETLTSLSAFLTAGTNVFCLIQTPEDSVTFNGAVGVFKATEIKEAVIGYNQLFELTGNLPEQNCKEFIKALCHRYNLLITTEDKVVEFYQYSTVYYNTPLDWTDKLSVSAKTVNLHTDFYGQTNNFEYLEDSHIEDGYADGEILIEDETLSSKAVAIKQPFAPSYDVVRLINLPVAKIELLQYDEAVVSAGSPPAIAPAGEVLLIDTIVNQTITFTGQQFTGYKGRKFKLETVKPRILYVDHTAVLGVNITYDDNTDTQTDGLTTEPLTHFNKVGYQYNLTFKPNQNGLIDNYTELSFALVLFKKVTLPFNLSPADALGFDFKKPVIVAGVKYYVNKIINFQVGKLTNVELIRM